MGQHANSSLHLFLVTLIRFNAFWFLRSSKEQKHMKLGFVFLLVIYLPVLCVSQIDVSNYTSNDPIFNNHKVILDKDGKLLPWYQPDALAYDQFLKQRWNFIKTKVPNCPGPGPISSYPQYYFYCAYIIKDGELIPDSWMNDLGERIPNWFESARLYYAYTGDTSVMGIVKKLIDYTLEHGITPSSFNWPDFPYTTTNAGETAFHGFTSAGRFMDHEVQVDHAGEMGLTYYRFYLYTGIEKYKTAAVNIANTLAANANDGTATHSVWPYRVVMSTGEVTAPYGANWMGSYDLLDHLVKAGIGNVDAYRNAMAKAKAFILNHPMKTGYWTDGHSDTDVKSHTYRSNLSASNMKLYLFDHPGFDTAWRTHIPQLIEWTEEYFINRSAPGEPSNLWGANIVGEQDSFLFKMDYQTARYGAECARWYAISGDETYKEKAYRSLNWVTYCSDSSGLAFESPLSKGINSWWSDTYGECPRMFYHAFAAVPEWAPPHENHILYSESILKNVIYKPKTVEYHATTGNGTEYIKLAFKPQKISLNGKTLALRTGIHQHGYFLKALGNGDYQIIITRAVPGKIIIRG